jgi:arsenate reductase
LLADAGRDAEFRHYLDHPPTLAELQDLFSKLDLAHPSQMMRSDFTVSDTPESCLSAIVDNPSLLQRPIYIDSIKAVIARPPELAL